MRRSVSMIVLLCVAAAVAGCAQTQDAFNAVQEVPKAFSTSSNLFKFDVPDWGKSNEAGNNFDLGPKGPVSADNLIRANGYCPPAAAPATPPAQAAAPQGAQGGNQAAAAPPPDRLEPAGGFAPASQPQVLGGVALGMSECAVARRLGTPNNVSISAGPKGQRRVVLTYLQGERPGLYSFQAGRLIQVDATPQQAAKYDRQVKKPSRRTRSRSNVQRMYVQ